MPEKPAQRNGSPAKPGEDSDLTRKLDAVQARTRIAVDTTEVAAVVEATAEATGTILDEAEAVQKLAATLPPPVGDKIVAAVTRIYEACNFQDITGQRITKVVKTLKYIESKIDALLAAFGDTVVGKRSLTLKSPDEDFVSGPQLPKAANSQDEIDAILASLDGK